MTDERAYWLAWSQIAGIGPTLLMRVYRHFGSLAAAWDAGVSDLEAVEGIGETTARAIAETRASLDPATLFADHQRDNPDLWTPADADYPRLLAEIPDPPPLLYYRGQVALAENRGEVGLVAIVGTRQPSSYGKQWTRRLVETLVQAGFTIVSGLAEGVDAIAHQACLDAGGRTIAVLGTGVNRVYPTHNRALAQQIDRKGLILSEYPRGTGPDRNHFPSRNRIIAGLCRATLVIEAGSKSGALITARVANDYGRDVYALPGSLDQPQSRGCLELIAGGAQLILDEASLLQSLGAIPPLDAPPKHSTPSQNLSPAKPPALDLPPHLEPIFQAIPPEAIALDTLVQTTQIDTSNLLVALLELEMLGVVSQLPGMRYCRA
ncbi:MAG: DNA-processing protein DprA [Cyanobacteriota bacterium]